MGLTKLLRNSPNCPFFLHSLVLPFNTMPPFYKVNLISLHSIDGFVSRLLMRKYTCAVNQFERNKLLFSYAKSDDPFLSHHLQIGYITGINVTKYG